MAASLLPVRIAASLRLCFGAVVKSTWVTRTGSVCRGALLDRGATHVLQGVQQDGSRASTLLRTARGLTLRNFPVNVLGSWLTAGHRNHRKRTREWRELRSSSLMCWVDFIQSELPNTSAQRAKPESSRSILKFYVKLCISLCVWGGHAYVHAFA